MAFADGTSGLAEIRRTAAEAVIWGAPLLLFDLVARAHPQSGRFLRLPAEAGFLAPGLAAAHGDICVCSAMIELAPGPARLTLPDAHGAYLSLVLHDERGRVLAATGSRRSEAAGCSLVIAGPDWTGEAPDAVVVRAPGERVWALARILGAGEGGRDDALRLQQAVVLTGAGDEAEADAAAAFDPELTFEAAFAALTPGEALDRLMRLAPRRPPAPFVEALARLGASDLGGLPGERRQALEDGAAEGLRRLRLARSSRPAASAGGWTTGARGGGRPALAALTALGAPPAEEVLVFTAFSDADGRPLSGHCDYGLVFDAGAGPPVEAFWSVCVVDPDGAPLQAPFARLSVGDWFGLTAPAAEPFEVRIQAGEGAEARPWLQPPAGPFGLRLELYCPKPAALAQAWRPPEPVNLGPRASVAVSLAAARSGVAASRGPRSGAGRDVIHFLSKGAQ